MEKGPRNDGASPRRMNLGGEMEKQEVGAGANWRQG